MTSLSRVAIILAHVALFLIALFLSQNPTYGMLLWIAAGLIALASVWWIF